MTAHRHSLLVRLRRKKDGHLRTLAHAHRTTSKPRRPNRGHRAQTVSVNPGRRRSPVTQCNPRGSTRPRAAWPRTRRRAHHAHRLASRPREKSANSMPSALASLGNSCFSSRNGLFCVLSDHGTMRWSGTSLERIAPLNPPVRPPGWSDSHQVGGAIRTIWRSAGRRRAAGAGLARG